MPIKAMSTEPRRFELISSDPGDETRPCDTYVWVRPAGQRENLLRGEILKDRYIGVGQEGISYNDTMLMYEEIWLTYHDAHIVIEHSDGSAAEPFKKGMARLEFMEALGMLPEPVKREWRGKVWEVNPSWRFPI